MVFVGRTGKLAGKLLVGLEANYDAVGCIVVCIALINADDR